VFLDQEAGRHGCVKPTADSADQLFQADEVTDVRNLSQLTLIMSGSNSYVTSVRRIEERYQVRIPTTSLAAHFS
jgi:hypothetical protein